MAKPVAKIVFKDKDGNYADCAVVWPATMKDGTVLEGRYNFQPVLEAKDGKYPAIPLVQAIERAAKKDGFLNFQLGFNEDGQKLAINAQQDDEF